MRSVKAKGPVTIKEIALRANVSHATVSLVINQRAGALRISEETQKRVRETAEAMGYEVNTLARALNSGRTQLIELWMHHPHAPFYSRMVYELRRLLRAEGYEAIITESDHVDSLRGDKTPRRLGATRWPVDGIIAVQMAGDVDAHLARLGDAWGTVPVVTIGSDGGTRGDCVIIDQRDAAREATESLIAAGRRRIVCVGFQGHTGPGDLRWDTYAEALSAAHLPTAGIFTEEETRPKTRQAVRRYFEENSTPEQRPDALVCRNDDLAIGAYRALCDLGLRVPEDVAVIGCDGIEDTEFLERPLSTIVKPVPDMCERAWTFLRARIADPTLPAQQTHFIARFERRASS